MKYSSNYSSFVDGLVGKLSLDAAQKATLKDEFVAERREHDAELERDFNLSTKKWMSILIGGLFVISYFILIVALYIVFETETSLIVTGKLLATERSVDSEVLMVLIGGTITQTALSFALFTRYVFGFKQRSDDTENDK